MLKNRGTLYHRVRTVPIITFCRIIKYCFPEVDRFVMKITVKFVSPYSFSRYSTNEIV
jgi:hypothetical protein